MKKPFLIAAALVVLGGALPAAQSQQPKQVTRVPVVFSEGHDTDRRDRGRPVVLIANALGVPPQVFRDAFSHVRPAQAGTEPEPRQVQANKAALMSALGKYGVTNERLDQVSNYYRYPPGRGKLWRVSPAVANALVQDGKITGYEIVSGGAGYTSPPIVSVPNMPDAKPTATLAFGKALETNGSVSAITIALAKTP